MFARGHRPGQLDRASVKEDEGSFGGRQLDRPANLAREIAMSTTPEDREEQHDRPTAEFVVKDLTQPGRFRVSAFHS